MRNGKKQICFTFGEREKEGKEKSCFYRVIDFFSVSPPKLVIKETLDVKAGHMLSTAGIKCQWRL